MKFILWNFCDCITIKSILFPYLFIYLALPTRAGSPQQHMPVAVGPFCLTHPVNFPCGRKPEYPEETHDFRQSVDFYSFHMRTGFESHWESSHWDLNLRPQRWKASALTTWPPNHTISIAWKLQVVWKLDFPTVFMHWIKIHTTSIIPLPFTDLPVPYRSPKVLTWLNKTSKWLRVAPQSI
jgi:hypothetical protein